MFDRLRLLALLGSRLLPVVGPLLIERDLLRSALAALEFEVGLARAAAQARSPANEAAIRGSAEAAINRGPVWL